MSSPVKVYFDESGFTGNNLLHPDQPVFSYGSVQVDEYEAYDFVQGIIKKYGVQGGELKGKNLIRYSKGRKALIEILSYFEGRIKVSVSNKKYALAGKFFEYIFEPVLQENNTLFYNLDFHRFISNILYLELVVRNASAEEIFKNFEEMMRTGKFNQLDSLFSSSSDQGISPMLKEIKEFTFHNRHAVAKELKEQVGEGEGKWVLDLTATALYSLLVEWGQEHEQVTAICDQSAPLSMDQSLFNTMINRTDKVYSPFGEKVLPITFNLSEPLILADSRITHGVQIADCIAAAFAYALNPSKTDNLTIKCRKYVPSSVISGSVFPDEDYIEINKHSVQLNIMVLHELHRRSEKGMDLLEGMPEFVSIIDNALIHAPLPI